MITIEIISIIAFVVALMRVIHKRLISKFSYEYDFPFAEVIASLIFFIFLANYLKKAPEIEVFPIASIERNSEINGSFFLGTGGVNSEMKYYAYWRLEDDRYKLIDMPIESVIIESDNDAPKYIVIPHCEEGMILRSCGYERKIFVSRGTIIKEFKL